MTTARSVIEAPRRFLIFMRRTTISHFAFLISNFSFKRSFHPQSTGIPPKGLTLNPLFIFSPQGSDHIPSSLPRSHQHLTDEDSVGAGLSHLFHDRL